MRSTPIPIADPVEVARRGRGVEMAEQRTGADRALLHEMLDAVERGDARGRPCVGEVAVEQRIEVVGAVDRCALADAAWVDPDEVEAPEHLVGQREARDAERGDRRLAGTARVDDERTDVALGIVGGSADDGELDLAAVRHVVVERYREPGALEAGGAVGDPVDAVTERAGAACGGQGIEGPGVVVERCVERVDRALEVAVVGDELVDGPVVVVDVRPGAGRLQAGEPVRQGGLGVDDATGGAHRELCRGGEVGHRGSRRREVGSGPGRAARVPPRAHGVPGRVSTWRGRRCGGRRCGRTTRRRAARSRRRSAPMRRRSPRVIATAPPAPGPRCARSSARSAHR